MNFGIARNDGQCSLAALHCFGGAAKAIEYIGHRHERICKARPHADRFLVVAQRKLEFAGSTIQVAQIEVSCRIVRFTGYGKLVCAASLIELGRFMGVISKSRIRCLWRIVWLIMPTKLAGLLKYAPVETPPVTHDGRAGRRWRGALVALAS